MDSAELPARSRSGMAAIDIFYTEFNHVNFYVEDEKQENLYHEIFKKLFLQVKIARIFPLGGKAAVFQHAASGPNERIQCFRAYIVDRDFDYLVGKRFVHPNVFYLDRFCIENYLLETSAVVEVVIENHPKRRRTDVEGALSLDAELLSLYNSLRPLFRLFFCAQSLNLAVKNCSFPPEAFCNPRRLWKIEDAVFARYEAELMATAQANLLDPPLLDWKNDVRLSAAVTASDDELVSGKFLAAMLFHYVKARFSLGSMTFESFIYRLAKNCKLTSMRAFAIRVSEAVRAHSAKSSIELYKEQNA